MFRLTRRRKRSSRFSPTSSSPYSCIDTEMSSRIFDRVRFIRLFPQVVSHDSGVPLYQTYAMRVDVLRVNDWNHVEPETYVDQKGWRNAYCLTHLASNPHLCSVHLRAGRVDPGVPAVLPRRLVPEVHWLVPARQGILYLLINRNYWSIEYRSR